VENVQNILGLTKVHGYGKVQIPADIRKLLNIKDGDKIAFIQGEDKRIYIENADSKKTGQGKYSI